MCEVGGLAAQRREIGGLAVQWSNFIMSRFYHIYNISTTVKFPTADLLNDKMCLKKLIKSRFTILSQTFTTLKFQAARTLGRQAANFTKMIKLKKFFSK
jgi:hypothetical protein